MILLNLSLSMIWQFNDFDKCMRKLPTSAKVLLESYFKHAFLQQI